MAPGGATLDLFQAASHTYRSRDFLDGPVEPSSRTLCGEVRWNWDSPAAREPGTRGLHHTGQICLFGKWGIA